MHMPLSTCRISSITSDQKSSMHKTLSHRLRQRDIESDSSAILHGKSVRAMWKAIAVNTSAHAHVRSKTNAIISWTTTTTTTTARTTTSRSATSSASASRLRHGMAAVVGHSNNTRMAVVTVPVRSKVTVTKTKGGTIPPPPPPPTAAEEQEPSLSAAAETATATKITVPSPTTNEDFQMPNMEKEYELMKIQRDIRAHYQEGNYKDALRVSRDFLDQTLDHFGKDHPATASAYNNIGLMYKSTGDWAESRKMYHESLRVYGRVLGTDHASYAGALHNIAALNKIQVHMDDALSGIQRLQLNEEAIDYFQEAWKIRQAELGEEHPHTIASRSYFASTLAAQVTQTFSNNNNNNNRKSTFRTSKLTQQRWQAAEEHLRGALKTATENPRGGKVEDLDGINTLSAASVAQTLAVFLKSRGTEIHDNDDNSNSDDDDDEAPKITIVDEEALAEAKVLYERVLQVRSALLHYAHPDLIATKYSLAELLEILGDKKGAADLRENIVNTYNVEEVDESEIDAAGARVEGENRDK